MLGIIFGVCILTMIGCFLYYYEEDKKLDREAAHNLAYVKNLRAQSWCSDAVGRALDDALFWNNLSQIYLDADLLYECRKCLSMSGDILEGITGQFDIHPLLYIPRTIKKLIGDAK
jgi:hypothetical protein|nr:MAG TPA: hypothetical protein [Caudoviricetes sp.]